MTHESHYIPPFTRINGPKQETVCGTWIRPSEHSNEPTCPACLRWLEQDAADTRTAEELFGEVQS
jgi:hypothetical protein